MDELHWIGLGQLGRGIDILQKAGAREAVMAGQVKHRRIFSDVVPDLKLLGVLARLAFQNTDSLIGAVADALARDGITLLPSVAFLGDQLAVAGPMTRRQPDREERRDVEYGETVARALAGMDLGQTAVVKHRAAVALEAMEGTDETIRRAGRIAGPGHDGGQGLEAAAGHAVRRAGGGRGDARGDARGGVEGARPRRGADPGDRPAGVPGPGGGGRGGRPRPRPGAGGGPEAMSDGTVKAGVIGVGALGRHHARVWAGVEGARLVGVFDTDAGRAAAVAAEHGGRAFPDAASLLAEVDAVSVAVPTESHHRVARLALEAGKDVLLEKPMTATLEEADDLMALAAARGAVLQVGHIERFNPATAALLSAGKGARFVEVHRLGSFSPRSLDVDVVLDLMIHDLDIVLALDGSAPVQIEAVGVPGPDPAGGHRERPAALRLGPHRQPDRQPGLGREGPQVPGLRPPDLRLGRLHRPGGPGLPPRSGRGGAARGSRPPGTGPPTRSPCACRSRPSPGRSGTDPGRSCPGRTDGGPWPWPTPSSAAWPRPEPRAAHPS